VYYALVSDDADFWLLQNLPEKLVGHEAVVYFVSSQLRIQSFLVYSPHAAVQVGSQMCFIAVHIFPPFLHCSMANKRNISLTKTTGRI